MLLKITSSSNGIKVIFFYKKMMGKRTLLIQKLVAQWLERLHGKRKVLGSIAGLGKHFVPKYDCSLHQEQSLKSLWMIGKDLRRNTLAWYTCPDQCTNVWLRPEDHQLRLENFYASSTTNNNIWTDPFVDAHLI